LLRLAHLDLPGLIKVQEDDGVRLVCSSSGRHRSAFDDDTGVIYFPERDQQLSRQRTIAVYVDGCGFRGKSPANPG
jgi:hypothetical protein